jgi:hypothetical protein
MKTIKNHEAFVVQDDDNKERKIYFCPTKNQPRKYNDQKTCQYCGKKIVDK